VRRYRTHLRGNNEQGVVILLVAVFMLFVVGAMAALSIDVVSLYTARSEAQLAADSAALAGARVLANSGLTSTSLGPAAAEAVATAVATQVATHNDVGGRRLKNAEVTVTFGGTTFVTNPHVTVQVQRTDLPTFFARIFGSSKLTVGASATAEAYNPSLLTGLTTGGGPPVAPICVKPWLLPNIDPTSLSTNPIFTPTGAIFDNTLVGKGWPSGPPSPNLNGLYARCSDCSGGIPTPLPGAYYPGAIDAADFPAPTQALPACSNGFKPYQLAVAGCVQQPVSCGPTAFVNIDVTAYGASRDSDTLQAAECLIHYGAALDTDSIDPTPPSPPFDFLAGNQNPVASAGTDVVVSDSLVTIPVINAPTNPAQVIGFLQVFLNPQSGTLPLPIPAGPDQLPVTIINMAGCGSSVTGNPILGNGASPVAVRLISPP
jgi:hypothetical protein